MERTLFDKIWDDHVVMDMGDGFALLHVDRHLITDAGSKALVDMRERGLAMRNPELAFASPDHSVTTTPGRTDLNAHSVRLVGNLRKEAQARGIRLFDMGSGAQGILHVVGPELGLTLPGALVVCADSHTCTHGGLGALGFGIGASEFAHVGATQTLVQQKPRNMRVRFAGAAATGTAPSSTGERCIPTRAPGSTARYSSMPAASRRRLPGAPVPNRSWPSMASFPIPR